MEYSIQAFVFMDEHVGDLCRKGNKTTGNEFL